MEIHTLTNEQLRRKLEAAAREAFRCGATNLDRDITAEERLDWERFWERFSVERGIRRGEAAE